MVNPRTFSIFYGLLGDPLSERLLIPWLKVVVSHHEMARLMADLTPQPSNLDETQNLGRTKPIFPNLVSASLIFSNLRLK